MCSLIEGAEQEYWKWQRIHTDIDFTTLILINTSRLFSIHLGYFSKPALTPMLLTRIKLETHSGNEEAYNTCDHQTPIKKDSCTNIRD